MGDMLAAVIFLPLIMLISLGFIVPVLVRAALEPGADRVVQAYVSKYAAYGTLDPIAQGDTTVVDGMSSMLTGRGFMNGTPEITCGTVVVDPAAQTYEVQASTGAVPANTIVGCRVKGTLADWPTIGPFMEAAPSIFGMNYEKTIIAYSYGTTGGTP